MCDYRNYFCLKLKLTLEERNWLEPYIEKLKSHWYYHNVNSICCFKSNNEAWFISEGGDCDARSLAYILQKFLQQFPDHPIIAIKYVVLSSDPSKYGGGGVIVTAEDYYSFSLYDYVRESYAKIANSMLMPDPEDAEQIQHFIHIG